MSEEIDANDFSTTERAELVAITINSLLFDCCYHQPSSTDVTLITNSDRLLDGYPSTLPIICGDFNVQIYLVTIQPHIKCWYSNIGLL